MGSPQLKDNAEYTFPRRLKYKEVRKMFFSLVRTFQYEIKIELDAEENRLIEYAHQSNRSDKSNSSQKGDLVDRVASRRATGKALRCSDSARATFRLPAELDATGKVFFKGISFFVPPKYAFSDLPEREQEFIADVRLGIEKYFSQSPRYV